nr:AzlC family ABC transporter permease [Nocardia sp. alder85J]
MDRTDRTGIAAVCLAVGMIGASYGATAVTSGLPVSLPLLLSVLVLAGGSEMLFVGIVAAGGSVIAAVLAGLLVNARHLPYGLSLPDVVGTGPRRLLGTHIMNDEAVAVALAHSEPRRRRAAYWLCGLGVLLVWPLGALLGVVIGSAVPDPNAFGLDAVFPAVLVALVLPAMRGDRATRWSALTGGIIAAGTVPLLAAGLPVLVALPVALLVAVVFTRNRPPATTTDEPGRDEWRYTHGWPGLLGRHRCGRTAGRRNSMPTRGSRTSHTATDESASTAADDRLVAAHSLTPTTTTESGTAMRATAPVRHAPALVRRRTSDAAELSASRGRDGGAPATEEDDDTVAVRGSDGAGGYEAREMLAHNTIRRDSAATGGGL